MEAPPPLRRREQVDLNDLKLMSIKEAIETPNMYGEPWYMPNFVTNIFGTTMMGKSKFLKWWLWGLHNFGGPDFKFDWAMAFSQTADLTEDLKMIPNPEERIIDGYNERIFIGVMQKIMGMIKSGGKAPRTCVILDDVIGASGDDEEDLELRKGPGANLWKKIAVGGRRYPATIFFLLQHITATPPILRSNAAYTVLTEISGNADEYVWLFAKKFNLGKKADVLNFMRSVCLRGQVMVLCKFGDCLRDAIRIIYVPQYNTPYYLICPKKDRKDVHKYFSRVRKLKPSEMDRVVNDSSAEPPSEPISGNDVERKTNG